MNERVREEVNRIYAHKGSGLTSFEVRSADFAKAQADAQMVYIRSERENAELRELVRDWREFAVGGADSLTDWNHQEAELEQRMRELGVEVD